MAITDLLYVAGIAIVLSLDHFVLWRTFLRRSELDPGKARLRIWSSWMVMLWALVAAGIVLWVVEERAWGSLGFVLPQGWRLWGGVGLVLALVLVFTRTCIRVARIPPSRRTYLRDQFGELAIVLPHTARELGWFWALSLTAGFCEEFIFRGYLIWVFKPLIGLWGAAALSAVAFGLAHAYQGTKGIWKTGVAAIVFTLIVLGTGSLYPAIALHALMDMGQGLLAWLALHETPMEDNGTAAPEMPA